MSPKDTIARIGVVNCGLASSYFVDEVADIFDPQCAALCFNAAAEPRAKRLVVVDSVVWKWRQDDMKRYFSENGLSARFLPFEAGEHNKSLSSVVSLWEAFDEFQLDRRFEPVLCIGGGVACDVVGFAASTYRRGVPLLRIPTTLMAMVDGAIGVKTAINFAGAKNRIGSFSPPLGVLIDWRFLEFLPMRHLANGLAEVVKIAVICDQALYESLESTSLAPLTPTPIDKRVLRKAIAAMLRELQPNLFEGNLARTVDFGHTFSTAIEMAVPNILHGEAVSIDIALTAAIATRRGLLGRQEMHRLLDTLVRFGLPVHAVNVSLEVLWGALVERTTHRGGQQNVPLPGPIGHCTFASDVSMEEIGHAVTMVR